VLSPDKGPDGAKFAEKHEILKKNPHDQTGIQKHHKKKI
jgi:hypothetical protein